MKFYEKNKNLNEVKIFQKGSLGLLALGDIGVERWKKANQQNTPTKIDEGN